jgi:hypothetical protein
MAFTRSGVRSPSPPFPEPAAGNVETVRRERSGVGRLDPTERLHLGRRAGIAQLVEHNLAKVGVAGSSPVSRSGAMQATRGGAVW